MLTLPTYLTMAKNPDIGRYAGHNDGNTYEKKAENNVGTNVGNDAENDIGNDAGNAVCNNAEQKGGKCVVVFAEHHA